MDQPVTTDLAAEAREIVATYAESVCGYSPYAAEYRAGRRDMDSEIAIAIAALQRGIEIAGPNALEALRRLIQDMEEATAGGMAWIDHSEVVEFKQRAKAAIAKVAKPQVMDFELLEACRLAVRIFDDDPSIDDWDTEMDRVRAAIAKATGES